MITVSLGIMYSHSHQWIDYIWLYFVIVYVREYVRWKLCDIYTHIHTLCEILWKIHEEFPSHFLKKALDMKKLNDYMPAKIMLNTQLSLCWPFKKWGWRWETLLFNSPSFTLSKLDFFCLWNNRHICVRQYI